MNKLQLESYVMEYGREIFSFCNMLTKNRLEAEDLYQDVFLKAIELDKLEEEKNPKSYLLSIAINLWKNKKRKFARRNRIAMMQPMSGDRKIEELPDGQNPLDEQFIQKQEEEKVKEAVKKLPSKMQMVILLFYMEELSVEEIAKVLKVPQGTVKSRLYQARKKLEKEMEAYFS